MPTYEYACRECGHQLEAVQSFHDDPLTVCPECGGELRKVFSAVGIVFKGSGFYKTDSRSGGKSSATIPPGESSTSSSSSSSESSTTKSTSESSTSSSTPAPAAPATSTPAAP